MAAIKGKDTKPEMAVRRILHALGFRYRLHRKDITGTPDIAFIGRRKVIFVHGCYWHGHDCKRGGRVPKTNAEYWIAKIGRNIERDAAHIAALQAADWSVLVVWECETSDTEKLTAKLTAFLT